MDKNILEKALETASKFNFHKVRETYWNNDDAIYVNWNLNDFICYFDKDQGVFKIIQEIKLKRKPHRYHHIRIKNDFNIKDSDCFYKMFGYLKKFTIAK